MNSAVAGGTMRCSYCLKIIWFGEWSRVLYKGSFYHTKCMKYVKAEENANK